MRTAIKAIRTMHLQPKKQNTFQKDYVTAKPIFA